MIRSAPGAEGVEESGYADPDNLGWRGDGRGHALPGPEPRKSAAPTRGGESWMGAASRTAAAALRRRRWRRDGPLATDTVGFTSAVCSSPLRVLANCALVSKTSQALLLQHTSSAA